MAEMLSQLAAKVVACRHCTDVFAATETAHEPNPIFQMSLTAKLCIAGQAPGLRAHVSGRPFTDPSGERLRAWLGLNDSIFYDSSKLAILPMAFCFAGYDARKSDLPPPSDCAKLWRTQIFKALPQLECIVLVGKSAIAWHQPALKPKPLTEIVRAGVIEGNPSYVPLPHPSWRNNSWLKANPWFDAEILPVLRENVSRLVSP